MELSPLPRPVEFELKEGSRQGSVVDEVQHKEKYENVEFINLIQLIRWDSGDESIRICYYKKYPDEPSWKYVNRPLNLNATELKKLFKKARNKEWFKKTLPLEI